jgi:hypothetical protein
VGEGAVSKSYFLMPFLVGHTRRARRLSNLIEGAVRCPAKSVNLFLNFGSVTSAANSAQREAPSRVFAARSSRAGIETQLPGVWAYDERSRPERARAKRRAGQSEICQRRGAAAGVCWLTPSASRPAIIFPAASLGHRRLSSHSQ